VWATSLSEGLTELSKGGVDIVLLDLGLPESSGPESCAWIREMALDVPWFLPEMLVPKPSCRHLPAVHGII
jgi:DNA-binding response OmpR family regulator